jgi:Rv0078B-related antitoxin
VSPGNGQAGRILGIDPGQDKVYSPMRMWLPVASGVLLSMGCSAALIGADVSLPDLGVTKTAALPSGRWVIIKEMRDGQGGVTQEPVMFHGKFMMRDLEGTGWGPIPIDWDPIGTRLAIHPTWMSVIQTAACQASTGYRAIVSNFAGSRAACALAILAANQDPNGSFSVSAGIPIEEGPFMQPTRELIDQLYRERVQRGREMRPEEKLLAGAELFEWACSITRAGIRQQNPDADESRIEALLEERLALQERLKSLP